MFHPLDDDVQQHIILLIECICFINTQMITGDMFTFSIIYTIVLFGFSQAYFFLYKGHENVEDTPYYSYMSTWMGLFQTTLGDYDVSIGVVVEGARTRRVV
jgi:hypothetical protein